MAAPVFPPRPPRRPEPTLPDPGREARLPWAPTFGRRCRARLSRDEAIHGYHGRCELVRGHELLGVEDHALERAFDTPRWSTRRWVD